MTGTGKRMRGEILTWEIMKTLGEMRSQVSSIFAAVGEPLSAAVGRVWIERGLAVAR
jgi:hypothetical protein